ncbi:MAG TPA: hypothetical protein DC057_05225 [Spirochaetia bacterium]|nr:hypothetical protein [Spirochaetia bacterium]
MKKQLQLKSLVKDNKIIKEGFISDLITSIIVKIMSPKMRQIDSLIEPEKRKEIADISKRLKDVIDHYNQRLDTPEGKQFLKDLNAKKEDFYIDRF